MSSVRWELSIMLVLSKGSAKKCRAEKLNLGLILCVLTPEPVFHGVVCHDFLFINSLFYSIPHSQEGKLEDLAKLFLLTN